MFLTSLIYEVIKLYIRDVRHKGDISMKNHIITMIQRSMTASICIVLSMFIISCNSVPNKIGHGNMEPVIYTKDITGSGLKHNIIVGEHGGYWTYYEEIKETGYNLTAETEVTDSFCLNECSSEEKHFPDANSAEPYKCTCTIGWTYHSINGDSSPAMSWSMHCIATGRVSVMENSFKPSGGKTHSTAEALSSAKLTCNNIILKHEQLNEKVESGMRPPLRADTFVFNIQPAGVLPAGSKTKSMAQAGLFCFLPPAQSSAKSNARVSINTLEFVNFHRVIEN